MSFPAPRHAGLQTDLYELTMAAAFWANGRADDELPPPPVMGVIGDDVAAGTAERNALATGSRNVPADGVAVGTLGAAVTVGPPRRSAISSAMAVPPPVPAPESTRTRHGDDVVRGASASEGICFTA